MNVLLLSFSPPFSLLKANWMLLNKSWCLKLDQHFLVVSGLLVTLEVLDENLWPGVE